VGWGSWRVRHLLALRHNANTHSWIPGNTQQTQPKPHFLNSRPTKEHTERTALPQLPYSSQPLRPIRSQQQRNCRSSPLVDTHITAQHSTPLATNSHTASKQANQPINQPASQSTHPPQPAGQQLPLVGGLRRRAAEAALVLALVAGECGEARSGRCRGQQCGVTVHLTSLPL